MPSRRPRSESSSTPSSQLPGVMEARRRRRRRGGAGRRRSRRRSSTRDTQQEEVRSQSSGASSRSASVEPEQTSSTQPNRRSCHLGNVNPYINFVSSSKGLYSGRPFRSMSKDLAARWRALPASEKEPFLVQARRSQAEIAKATARGSVGWRSPPRRHAPGRYFHKRSQKCHRRVVISPRVIRLNNFRVEAPGQLCRKYPPVQDYRSYCKLILIPIVYCSMVLLLVVGATFFFFWVPRDWLFGRRRSHSKRHPYLESELDS